MNNTNQVSETKDQIKNALFSIMNRKKYDDITMSEIAKEAGIVRMTVYRNFKEKDRILLYAFDSYIDMINKDEELDCEFDLEKSIKLSMQALKNSNYTKFLAENDLLDAIFERSLGDNGLYFSKNISRSDNKYIEKFIMGGINFITKEWINDGMNKSCGEIAREIKDIIIKLD